MSVEKYVIMPNHIHLLLWVKENKNKTDNGQSRTPVPTNVERANNVCSQFVSTFKRFCNKEYGENIWQARFNDHIIRNRDDYEEHVKYIYTRFVGIMMNYIQKKEETIYREIDTLLTNLGYKKSK